MQKVVLAWMLLALNGRRVRKQGGTDSLLSEAEEELRGPKTKALLPLIMAFYPGSSDAFAGVGSRSMISPSTRPAMHVSNPWSSQLQSYPNQARPVETQARMLLPGSVWKIERGSKVRARQPASKEMQGTGIVWKLDEDPLYMLALMERWVLDEQVSTPYKADNIKDACMVPIQVDWFNEEICAIESCPAALKDDFKSVWEAVAADGEGCVTVQRLRAKIAANVRVVVLFGARADHAESLTLDKLEVVESPPEKKKARAVMLPRMSIGENSPRIQIGSKVRVLSERSKKYQDIGRVSKVDEAPSMMLNMMDRWMLGEQNSKQYEDDDTLDACMVPIEVDWLNEQLCRWEECPVTVQDGFKAVWQDVTTDGEGCVTVRRLRDKLRKNAKYAEVVVDFGLFSHHTFALHQLEEI